MNEVQEQLVPAAPLPLPLRLQESGMAGFLVLFEEEIHQALNSVRNVAASLAERNVLAPFDPATVPQALAANLAENLLAIVQRTLVLELNIARLQNVLEGETARERFDHFLRRLKSPAVAQSLRAEYPLLFEQVSTRLRLWAAYSAEFLRHLCEDWEDIAAAFFATDPGKLVSARFGAGDSHRQGRSVMVLQFESGQKLVYKPRAMAVDRHFNGLLCWLNHKGAQPQFRALSSLDKGAHGWAEFAHREECRNEAEVRRFYERQGGLLAVLYALQANDFHRENLIAAGEHPMLIDLETLLQPCHLLAAPGDRTTELVCSTALRTGLLPAPFLPPELASGPDMSGLGGAGGQVVPDGESHWERPDTDEMRLVTKPMQMSASENRPIWNGHEVDALAYAEEIAAGFARGYNLLLTHRDEVLAFVEQFSDDEVRVIVRPTQFYACFLEDACHPDMQRDPAEREKLFDRLAGMNGFRAAEQRDLRLGDVPIFTTRANSLHVWTSEGECIPDYFSESGLSSVRERIKGLSARDLEKQLWIIRTSLSSMAPAAERSTVAELQTSHVREAATDELLREACKIGDRLEALAFCSSQTTWLGLSQIEEQSWVFSALDKSLYDGLPGVILFLAYLGHITVTDRYTALAANALASLRRLVDEDTQAPDPGAFSGWGGLLYCYAHLAALWKDGTLLAEAERMAVRAGQRIASDDALDVIGGVAGLALQLRCLSGSGITQIARECGSRLQATALHLERGVGWPAGRIANAPLTGFAHGNAGIACALLELSALCREPGFAVTAEQAFEYERSVFSGEHGNWPDFRHSGIARFECAWCHGAPGIVLSRLAALCHGRSETLLSEIHAGLNTTLREGFGGSHCLCHGEMGNIEVLLYASAALCDPEWIRKARKLAAGALDRSRQTGWICGNGLGIESTGLMTGIAGIGYELLRLAHPDKVPSVLALDPPIQA